MRITDRFLFGFRHPFWTGWYIASKLNPNLLYGRYGKLAKRQGLDRPYFILSFDCDTEKDAAVVEEVHNRLVGIGVHPVYAVPGELMEKHANVFKRIASTGSEFMNHGYKIHTYYDDTISDYQSCFFYDRISEDRIIEDITKGHDTHLHVLGKAPNSFRVPHFGTFQRRRQLKFLHHCLSRLGYQFSSSTEPLYAFRYGPLKDVGNRLREVPVSGCFDDPLIILDSWGFMIRKFGNRNEELYKEQMKKMVLWFTKRKLPGLLNFYADPSHVIHSNSFFEAILFAKERIAFLDSYDRLDGVIRSRFAPLNN
jgi:peptidoglycan/xylan/chitin deacetylase (PgdA/CDA1 family)